MTLSNTSAATVPAGAIEAGAVVEFPCGYVATLTGRELFGAGEVALFYGATRERVIFPKMAPLRVLSF